MKKIILILLSVVFLLSEPISYGAYYGNIKEKKFIGEWISYPENDVSSAGLIYLFKNKINIVDYIYDTKIKHIKNGLKQAKARALKKHFKFFAIDNITHQVIITENEVVIMTHFNILGFN